LSGALPFADGFKSPGLDQSCQNCGVSKTRMVKISKRPAIIAKLISQVE
jgi:hypothetical protein